jgi:hypothetical protein
MPSSFSLTGTLEAVIKLEKTVRRTSSIAIEGFGCCGGLATTRLRKIGRSLPVLLESVKDLIAFAEDLQQLYPDESTAVDKALEVFQSLMSASRATSEELSRLSNRIYNSFPALTKCETRPFAVATRSTDKSFTSQRKLVSLTMPRRCCRMR